MEGTYTAQNVPVEINYDSVKIPGFNYMDYGLSTNVQYNVTVDARNWGIKDISFYAISQEVTFYMNLESQETGDDEEFQFTVKLTDIETQGPDRLDGMAATLLELEFTEVHKDGAGYQAVAKGTLVFGDS